MFFFFNVFTMFFFFWYVPTSYVNWATGFLIVLGLGSFFFSWGGGEVRNASSESSLMVKNRHTQPR